MFTAGLKLRLRLTWTCASLKQLTYLGQVSSHERSLWEPSRFIRQPGGSMQRHTSARTDSPAIEIHAPNHVLACCYLDWSDDAVSVISALGARRTWIGTVLDDNRDHRSHQRAP